MRKRVGGGGEEAGEYKQFGAKANGCGGLELIGIVHYFRGRCGESESRIHFWLPIIFIHVHTHVCVDYEHMYYGVHVRVRMSCA